MVESVLIDLLVVQHTIQQVAKVIKLGFIRMNINREEIWTRKKQFQGLGLAHPYALEWFHSPIDETGRHTNCPLVRYIIVGS